ncbi:S1 domain-containing protein [Halocalculus aciditolerans]|nr:hypothetical protein [Halocalculus aciditolerans]
MSSNLRPLSIESPTGESYTATMVVGVDESGNDATGSDYYVAVAVRALRADETALVSAMVENDLRPFEHKSVSTVRHRGMTPEERQERVGGFITDLDETDVSWSAVVCSGSHSNRAHAAASSVAAKKSITSALATDAERIAQSRAVLLHDGKPDPYQGFTDTLRRQTRSDFDTGFEQGVCPVYLAFLQDADRTYPESNAADYVAGYIRNYLNDGGSLTAIDGPVDSLDSSWIQPAERPVQPYHLEDVRPVKGEGVRSLVLAWLLGRGIPNEPAPTTDNPYRALVDEIDNSVVKTYLLEEL